MKILTLMILAHILDDFVLQPQCLSDLKQKEWWYKRGIWKGKYKLDFLCAGLIHAISWSILISLPIIFLGDITGPKEIYLGIAIILNMVIHFIVDNFKANLKVLNLWQDQLIHFVQIFILYEIFT